MLYNTAFDIGFSLVHGYEDPHDVPKSELIAALEDRIQQLKDEPDEAAEAFGVLDTYDVENPHVPCVVVGTNPYDTPATFPVLVLCPDFEREQGNHLQAACKYAQGDPTCQNAVAYDDSTPDGRDLLSTYHFIRLAPLIGLHGRLIPRPRRAAGRTATPPEQV